MFWTTSQQVDASVRDRANLKTLQRLDPDVVDVLCSATHVTMYQFDSATVKWARYDCEGPLFVVKRDAVSAFSKAICIVSLPKITFSDEHFLFVFTGSTVSTHDRQPAISQQFRA